MVSSANLGFPRIGANRELKKLIEAYWAGKVDVEALRTGAAELRATHWKVQRDAGVDVIPSNDFSYYDQVLDTMVVFDAIPQLYRGISDATDRYFAMARGMQAKGVDVPAIEMKKWFDTNYHYIVPRFGKDSHFRLAAESKPVTEFKEALALGIRTRPVVLGPISFLRLGRPATADFDVLSLVDELVPRYVELLAQLRAAGATEVQLDEPTLVTDVNDATLAALTKAYVALAATDVQITLATYFGALSPAALTAVAALPAAVREVHVDLVRAPQQLDAVVMALQPTGKRVSLGLVNGRNVWKADLKAALTLARHATAVLGADRVVVAPSCSLLHTPVSLAAEVGAGATLDEELRAWLAFSTEKLAEVRVLAEALKGGDAALAVAEQLQANATACASRRASARIHNAAVKARVQQLTPADYSRPSPFPARWAKQQAKLNLPEFPTTTIGSFPQTAEVRAARANLRKGKISEKEYWAFIDAETEKCIRIQEELGLDVLVHGEFERNDMVEFFGENLAGFAFSKNGWVQSYGTRCVKPPLIFGDVSRPTPMTVNVTARAQALTSKPVKGMLTGPITILQWSFVRDDQPRSATATQIALAIRDEVVDLERAGIQVIQVDEPAIREGLPLVRGEWAEYLEWAVGAFRLSTVAVKDETQIHSHMCYSDFNDIMSAIVAMDVDALSIEAAKSDAKLLTAFATATAGSDASYTNGIGPGLFDIHSPRVPPVAEMEHLARAFLRALPGGRAQLWCNPDCGLKTRGWAEVKGALANLVAVARALRADKVAGTPADVAPLKAVVGTGVDAHAAAATSCCGCN